MSVLTNPIYYAYGGNTLRRLAPITLMLLLLAACAPTPEAPPDPLTLLDEAAVHINDAESFRIEIRQEGAPYFIETDVIEGALRFERAQMDYVAPETLQGLIRASLGLLGREVPFELGIMARGPYQWVQLAGADWTDQLYFAPGFDARTLIAEDAGFQAALDALIDVEYVGPETLDTGERVYHLRGQADGPAVSELLVYIITAEDPVTIDAYIGQQDSLPVRLTVTLPDTETEDNPEPTQFIVELYDFNGVDVENDITGPSYEASGGVPPTAEVTPLLDTDTERLTPEASP
ncbi:MAG: LppX_LprAFG lipoprotein [Chloroflexota bacterium]